VTAVRAWGAARRVGGMDRDVDKPGEASNRPSPFLNSLKHEPTTRFHKSLIGLCRSRSCDSCRAPADAARRPKRRVRALVGHDRQLQSRSVDHGRYSRSRAYGAPAATHLLKELPRGKHLAVLTGARRVALQIGARTRLGTKGERCSVAFVLRCTLIVCIRRPRSDSAQHFTLTGAAPPALALRRSQAWRAGHMHLDAYDEVERTGACLRLVHHDCWAAHRYPTFIRSVKISEFGTSAHRHSMPS
jgi:hypothetical protein